MSGDHGAAEPFTDEEFAFLRYARFGSLPDRVRPEDRIELTETDPRRDRPEPEDPHEWALRAGH